MRVFSTALIALVSLAQAQAEEPTNSEKTRYYLRLYHQGTLLEVPPSQTLCWRSPPPYGAEYALLHCYPPFQEGILVKRGNSRCGGRYEDRER